jgi:hypothetical protein
MHTFSRTVTYTRVTRWPSSSQRAAPAVAWLPQAVRKRSVLCGGARAQGSPRPAWSGVWPVISITTHTSTLKQPSPPPSPSPMGPWQTPHAPSPPSCRAARGRGRPLALSIPSFMVLSCTSSASMLVLPYPSHSRVSLYCCVVVSHSARLSPFLHSSCFHMLVLPVLPHARACIPITLTLLYRCISLSPCIVVSLYLVVSLYRCVVVSRGLVLPMYLARS